MNTSSHNMSRHPEILWAQRSDKVYLTIAVLDAKDVCLKCEPEGLLNFSAVGAHGEKYECTLELHGSILPEESKTKVGLRNILCTVKKEKKEWWVRLLKSEEKPASYIKVDWNKWCDEDDESSDSTSEEDTVQYNDEGSSDEDGLLYLPDLEKLRGK